jgi:hypothetical protein
MPKPNALVGFIRKISLFGELVDLPNGQFNQYKGEPLFVTALSLDSADLLEVTIDDIGPPAATLTLPRTPASAFASITYKKHTETIVYDPTQKLPLIIRAALPTPPAAKWTNAEVVPVVEVWVLPRGKDVLDFVIFHVVGTDGRLWWLTNPPFENETLSADIVPEVPVVGLNGPFGIETP